MSRSNGFRVEDAVKLRASDVSWSSWVFAVELCCEFWHRDFGSELPGVVFTAISFPLDEVLESSPMPTAVKYLLYFPLQFSVNDYGQWVTFCSPACDWVVQSQGKLHYIEHWMELLHPVWQS